MKISAALKIRRVAGILLVECVTYIAVLVILAGFGTATFYLCWDHSKAVVCATDDIGSALRAGERWRADVRNATGEITVEDSTNGEVMRIPGPGEEVIYHFESGTVRREIPGRENSQLLLARVNTSQMTRETRAGVMAWRWELDVVVRRPETQLPLLFTFETARTKP